MNSMPSLMLKFNAPFHISITIRSDSFIVGFFRPFFARAGQSDLWRGRADESERHSLPAVGASFGRGWQTRTALSLTLFHRILFGIAIMHAACLICVLSSLYLSVVCLASALVSLNLAASTVSTLFTNTHIHTFTYTHTHIHTHASQTHTRAGYMSRFRGHCARVFGRPQHSERQLQLVELLGCDCADAGDGRVAHV